MAISPINIGSSANDGTGTKGRAAGAILNNLIARHNVLDNGYIALSNGGLALTPDDCGKRFSDELCAGWVWIEFPNAADCIAKPGITFRMTRPVGGNRGGVVTVLYPRYEGEGDDGYEHRWFKVGTICDLDAFSTFGPGIVKFEALAVNQWKLPINNLRPTDVSPGQAVTGLTSGFSGTLIGCGNYSLLIKPDTDTPDPIAEESITLTDAATESISTTPRFITNRWEATEFTVAGDQRND